MDVRPELLKHLGLSTFVVVDLETTGLIPDRDKIIEVGAIKYEDGKETGTFESLINPGIPIPENITRLTGISDDDVKDSPAIKKVFPDLEKFLAKAPFVGHQVNFDASFLEYQFRTIHDDFDQWDDKLNRFKYFGSIRIDTLFLSRILLPFLPKLKLSYLSDFFSHDLENAHRAIDDARATATVFFELLDRALALDNQIITEIIQLLFANSVRAKSFFVPLLKFKTENNISVPALSMVDDIKLAQEYYNVIGESEYKISYFDEEREHVIINPDEVEDYFKDDGLLSTVIESYESRNEQHTMCIKITDALNEGALIVAEAGTGTGKSMAYLVPAVEWAVRNREGHERVVVSTNTKNLQEQLFFKDLPTLYRARKGNFKAVLLKGRANYLCLDKWRTVMTDMNQRLSQDERTRILPLVLWARQTRTGDISENNAFQAENNIGLWQKFIAEPAYCPGKACKLYDDCYLMKAREHARKADLVIVNHALLFSDLASENSILGEFENLVIDEAHNIEKSAADHLGLRINYWRFRNIYHTLYEEDPRKSGTLLQLDYRLNQSKLNEKEKNELLGLVGRLKHNSMRLKASVTQFYGEFNQYMRQQVEKGSAQNGDGRKVRYFKSFRFFRENEEQILDIRKTLGIITKQLGELNELLYDLRKESFEFQDQIHRELISIEKDLLELSIGFDFCISADEPKYVYWLDIPLSERNVDVVMNAVPLNVAEILEQKLFKKLRSAVLTSATLSVNKTFDYFDQRIGLNLLEDRQIVNSAHGSPFNYAEQLLLAVTDFLPDPRNQDFTTQLGGLIKEIHDSQKRGMMVLFTNYSQLNFIYNKLKLHFDVERILLLAQGKSGSRTNIINQFKENHDSILFGTDSFWEGVDVPGDALQILMIPKLPFDVPTEPLVAARMEEIKERGGNPFFEYSVPEAIIKFRQGFGRLIRHKNDFGTVIACDNRLSRMQYGRQFLNSLPVEANIFFKQDELIERLQTWFNGKPV